VFDQRGRTLFDALHAFFEEHQYCGDLDGGVEGDRVWMTSTCGSLINRDADLIDQRGQDADLVAELLQDGGSKLVAVDRLRQIVLKSRRAHAGISHAARDEGDARYPASLADVQVSKSLQELAGSGLGRGEVAHDDIGDERGTNRVVGPGGGDERAREFEYRPKGVARELVVIDYQDVNPSEFRRQFVHLLLAWSAPCRMALTSLWPSRR
jgi:hypothetical protein